MALSIIIPTSSSTGELFSCNNPPSAIQCGNSNCTLSQIGPPYFCQITVTFSPAFATTPKHLSAQITGCDPATCHLETFSFIPTASLTIESDSGTTWANMPVATTELYGNVNHEVGFDTPLGLSGASFNILCITGSSSATAKLRPQYSSDGGNAWFDLAATGGAMDADVSANNCGFGINGVLPISSGFVNIPTAVSNCICQFRVVGFNGGGAGDNPVFNNIQIVFSYKSNNPFYTCVPVPPYNFCAGSNVAPSKTGFVFSINSMVTPGSWIISAEWIAIE